MRSRKFPSASSSSSTPQPKPAARVARARGTRRSARPRAARRTQGIALGAALTIGEVGACRAQLQRLLRAGAARNVPAIDAQSLHSIDTAGLQLLLVAGQSARQRGRRLVVAGAGDLLRAAAAALGLQATLATALELQP